MPIILSSMSSENLIALAIGVVIIIGLTISIYSVAPRVESPEESDQRHFRSNTKSYLSAYKNDLKSYQPPKKLK